MLHIPLYVWLILLQNTDFAILFTALTRLESVLMPPRHLSSENWWLFLQRYMWPKREGDCSLPFSKKD